jgi:hypothetical protein
MEDICTYWIEIRGRAHAEDLNAASSLVLVVEQSGPDSTLLSTRTDQSGLVGIIRHLHGMGIILLSIQVQPRPSES